MNLETLSHVCRLSVKQLWANTVVSSSFGYLVLDATHGIILTITRAGLHIFKFSVFVCDIIDFCGIFGCC